MIALKTHTDIDIVKSWPLEKQVGWIYALSTLYNTDELKDVQKTASTVKPNVSGPATRSMPTPSVKRPPRSDLPGGVFTRRFTVGDDGYVREQTEL